MVNQPGFFATGHHVNRETQNLGGAGQKFVAVACFAQGLGGDRADLVALEAAQAFTETRQAVPSGLHGLRGQVTVGVESAALTDRLFDVFGADKFLVLHDADL